MKKLLILLFILCITTSVYADSKVSDLTDIVSPGTGDDMYIVDDPDGTPASKKINVGALLGVSPALDTDGTITDDYIDSADYAAGSVDLEHMSAHSVDSNQYVDGSIDKVHLAGDVIDETKLEDDSLDSEHYNDDSIDDAHINWGTGATQVSTDDITEGSTNLYQLTEEEVEDYAGGMLGGTETHISVTYQDGTNDIDFVVDQDSAAGAITEGAYNDSSIVSADIKDDTIDSADYAADSIDDEHINWGGGAGQVNSDDVTEGATNLYQLTEEEVEDYAGGMLGGTETRITVTYQDATGDIDFVVDDMNDDVPDAGDFGNAADLDANGEVADDSHNHVYSNIDAFTEANLYSILSDVTQFYEAGDEDTIAGAISEGALTNSSVVSADIKDDTIQAVDLEATNAEADNDIVTYDSGTGGFTFNTCAEITGSADLCDGSDDGAGGNSYAVFYGGNGGITTADATADEMTVTGATGITVAVTTDTITIGNSSSGGAANFLWPIDVQSVKLDSNSPPAIDAGNRRWRLLFDDSTEEIMSGQTVMVNYNSGTVTADLIYSMASATSGTAAMKVQVMCVTDGDSADIDTDSFDTPNIGTDTVPGTAGHPGKISITLSNKDSCADGDLMIVAVSRDMHTDDASGDLELRGVTIYE